MVLLHLMAIMVVGALLAMVIGVWPASIAVGAYMWLRYQDEFGRPS